jgi:hypothetical protein
MSEEYEYATYLQQVEPELTCSPGLSIGSNYSGHEPEEFVTTNDQYETAQPAATVHAVNVHAVNKRRHLRVFCRSARACIRTESASFIVYLTDVSRSGMCFRTTQQFRTGTPISVATHYIEGGENIFQNGQIVRVRYSPSGDIAEYGVEF